MNNIFLPICILLSLFVSCNNQPKETKINPLTYWDNKIDTLIAQQSREQTEKAFCEFVSTFATTSEDTIRMSIHHLMKQCEKDPMYYMQMALAAEMLLYGNNSPLMNEDYYIYFLEEIQATECLNKGYKFRYEKQLEACLKNRPGTQASDIHFIDTHGNENSLHELEAKHVLLIFYSPSCHKCHDVMNQLKQDEQFNQWITSEELKVLAMYADGNQEEWTSEKDYFPPTWINGYDHKDEIYTKGTYQLRMSPTMYLLDSNKKVILKDTKLEDITKYFLSLQTIKKK